MLVALRRLDLLEQFAAALDGALDETGLAPRATSRYANHREGCMAPFWRKLSFWQGAGTVLSLAIAFWAALFTALQWKTINDQWLFANKPNILFDTEDDPEVPPVGISAVNAGPGLAIIQRVTYFYDRKPVKDYKEALDFGKINTDIADYVELEPDDPMPIGDKTWLFKYLKPKAAKFKQKDLDDLIDFIDEHVSIKIDFCSAMGSPCWDKCSKRDWCPATHN